MKYMLMLRYEKDAGPAEGTPEFDAEMQQWGELSQQLQESGVFLAALGLDSEDTATTLRVRDGDTVLSDGPFAETKELFFSYYLLDVPDLDAAIEWAARMPNAAYGSVEIRPLSPHSQAA
ncbi:MAG: YciI family protein [Actinomycetota bacterium]|nr:YciI family protein [Actinomycetota bacterium]